MTLNQEALAKAEKEIEGATWQGAERSTAIRTITTYLTEINKTHVLVPRELPDGLDFEIPLMDGMDLWKALISAIDALAAGGR